jgi:hypothetical protein
LAAWSTRFLKGLTALECDFDFAAGRRAGNEAGTGYFHDVVAMAAGAVFELVWANAIAGDAVDEAFFEKKILPGFADVRANDSEILFDRDFAIDFYIQGPRVKRFARGLLENFVEKGHAFLEMLKSGNDAAFYGKH